MPICKSSCQDHETVDSKTKPPGGIVSLDYIDSGTWAEVNLEIDDSQNLQYGRGKGWVWGGIKADSQEHSQPPR